MKRCRHYLFAKVLPRDKGDPSYPLRGRYCGLLEYPHIMPHRFNEIMMSHALAIGISPSLHLFRVACGDRPHISFHLLDEIIHDRPAFSAITIGFVEQASRPIWLCHSGCCCISLTRRTLWQPYRVARSQATFQPSFQCSGSTASRQRQQRSCLHYCCKSTSTLRLLFTPQQ